MKIFNKILITQIVMMVFLISFSISCKKASDNTPTPTPTQFTYGGQLYHTVQIGTQCVMKENLNIGTMINGNSPQTNNSTIEKYCYNNDPANCTIYGGLYQWDEMMQYSTTEGIQGICPAGWHIPTDTEWTTLVNFLGGDTVAGGKMKETGFAHWASPNIGATNESGFAAFGAGYRVGAGGFDGLQNYADFWSSSQLGATSHLYYNDSDVNQGTYLDETLGFSLRCFKD